MLSFIQSNGVGVDVCERVLPPPGVIVAAAIDWTLVLTAAGVAVQFASLLWGAYDRFIAPKKTGKDDAGIVISLQRGDGTSDMFWIGNSHTDRDAFIAEFSRKVETIRQTNALGESVEHVVDETR